MKKFALKKNRGFGLIDVSLGIIAGLGLLVGAVILFQQVTTNNAVSEITRNAVTISSEMRAAARSLPAVAALSADYEGQPGAYTVDIANFGLEPGLINGVSVSTQMPGDIFTLTFSGLNPRACTRAAVSQNNLGSNVRTAYCYAATGILIVNYNR